MRITDQNWKAVRASEEGQGWRVVFTNERSGLSTSKYIRVPHTSSDAILDLVEEEKHPDDFQLLEDMETL
ncbi:hypothetical protein CEK60_16040 [Halomonas sp. N3-2A]|nr:hypothetical protein CEK60_16040 [Halomonas sp. N3-2A]